MPELARMEQRPKRIPEPACAAVRGEDWGATEHAELEALLREELTPLWLGQARKGKALADQAEDVVQGFLVKIHKSLIKKYEPSKAGSGATSLIPFLGTCFNRHLADAWRRHQREERWEEPLDNDHYRGHVVHIQPERQAELIALRDAIETLSERRRKVIRLSGEGYTFAEIGQALGIRENHARVEAHGARQQLKRILEKGESHV